MNVVISIMIGAVIVTSIILILLSVRDTAVVAAILVIILTLKARNVVVRFEVLRRIGVQDLFDCSSFL
jgi:hypothetical protein